MQEAMVPARVAETERRISRLERENRELRGENRKLNNDVIALRHGIQKVADECQTMLQDGPWENSTAATHTSRI